MIKTANWVIALSPMVVSWRRQAIAHAPEDLTTMAHSYIGRFLAKTLGIEMRAGKRKSAA